MFLVDFVLNDVFMTGHIDLVGRFHFCYLATLLLSLAPIGQPCTSVALLVPARVAPAVY